MESCTLPELPGYGASSNIYVSWLHFDWEFTAVFHHERCRPGREKMDLGTLRNSLSLTLDCAFWNRCEFCECCWCTLTYGKCYHVDPFSRSFVRNKRDHFISFWDILGVKSFFVDVCAPCLGIKIDHISDDFLFFLNSSRAASQVGTLCMSCLDLPYVFGPYPQLSKWGGCSVFFPPRLIVSSGAVFFWKKNMFPLPLLCDFPPRLTFAGTLGCQCCE